MVHMSLVSEAQNLEAQNFLSPFEHQVGGHGRGQFIEWNENKILKPKLKPNLFAREIEFYERIQNEHISTDYSQYNGCKVFPQYFGLAWLKFTEESRSSMHLVTKEEPNSFPYIVLENVTFKFCHPCIIDVKLGTQTYEPSASLEKIEYECSKYPFQRDLGFRLTGFKTFNLIHQEYFVFDKHMCRQLIPEIDLLHGIALAFFNGIAFHSKVLVKLLSKIEDLLGWMEEQQEYNFYSSSVLIVYSGSAIYYGSDIKHGDKEKRKDERIAMNSTIESDEQVVDCDVRLIDFGHVQYISVPSVPKDPGCILGLKTLTSYLKRVLSLIQHDPGGMEQHVNFLLSRGKKTTI